MFVYYNPNPAGRIVGVDEIKSRLKHNKKNQNGGMKDESAISNVQ